MVDYVPYPHTTMPHGDFDLYSNQEQQLEYLPHGQPFMPSTSYPIDPAFNAPYESLMPAMSEPPRPQELQSYYDGIAQGVKPFHSYSPTQSPNSTAHSFQDQPPVLSASSESGASVSSSNLNSPSLNPHFAETWNPMAGGLGLTSGYEYNGMVATDKLQGCVGESNNLLTRFEPSSSVKSSAISNFPSSRSDSAVFRSPTTPASAKSSAPRQHGVGRRNSLLSNQVRHSSPNLSQSNFIPPLESSYPNLVQPSFVNQVNFVPPSPYPEIRTTPSPFYPVFEHPPSPAPSHGSSHSQHRPGSKHIKRGSQSPYLHTQHFHPYPTNALRRRSDASLHSQNSGTSRKSGGSYELDEETREKGMCPLPECGRVFKDLKAHMLTHQNERPEKCPIATCEYHLKGFARKYDKNRHTLTHYKGTMVCGFCPGSGSAAEKSFNRADVFKRHLTSVHGVEQNPPNSRKKSPAGRKALMPSQTGLATCSTCQAAFDSPQALYDHIDECVMRVVQETEPSEAVNQRQLTSIANDQEVTDTLHRNGLPSNIDYVPSYDNEDEDDDDLEDIDVDDHNDSTYGVRRSRSGSAKVTKSSGKAPRPGLTYSKNGVAISSSGRKKRKNYPAAWGCSIDKMKMKKRVLCVYDGPRRLWKDEMMLDSEFEVRLNMNSNGEHGSDGSGKKWFLTDLDVQTLKKAEALHNATAEEKGPWIPDNVRSGDVDDQFVV